MIQTRRAPRYPGPIFLILDGFAGHVSDAVDGSCHCDARWAINAAVCVAFDVKHATVALNLERTNIGSFALLAIAHLNASTRRFQRGNIRGISRGITRSEILQMFADHHRIWLGCSVHHRK
jgi:hypothetical protein